jgi:hypothetical protein
MLLGQWNGGFERVCADGESRAGCAPGGRWDARPLSNCMVKPETHEKPPLTPAAATARSPWKTLVCV